jgi:hypothetical protein
MRASTPTKWPLSRRSEPRAMRIFTLAALAAASAFVVSSSGVVHAQNAMTPLPLDPQIVAAVAAVSADRLRATDEKLVSFGTRSTFSERSAPGRGIFAARDWLAGQFRAIAATTNGRMTVALDTYTQEAGPRVPRAVPISSVIATLKGDDPSGRIVVIASHLDSRNTDDNDGVHDAPGADDNGSAVAQALEAARILAPMHVHATVVFAAFDSEEQGLYGSGHFAKSEKDAGANIDAVLNSDIIGSSTAHDGTTHPYDVRLFSEAVGAATDPKRLNALGSENDSPSRELARFAKETGEAYVPAMHIAMIYRMDRFLRGGDQSSFAEQGFPAVRYVEAAENFDHQHQNVRTEGGVEYGDLVKFMDFAYLARVVQINVADLATLALGPDRPANVKIVAKNLSYDTTLTWTAVPYATSYEIVRRRSQDQNWSIVTNVGDATTGTVNVSKDDWLFGVRSVDAQGRRSVAVFPDVSRT